MNVNEAAKRLGVSPRRVVAMIAAGQISAIKAGGRWEISGLPVARRTRRPLSPHSRALLASALHARSLAGLSGQDLARTAARIRELRSAENPARLLSAWWGGAPDDALNFGTNLVQHAIEGDEAYVTAALHRRRREYLRNPQDLADTVKSERRIRGLTPQGLAEAAHVPLEEVRAIERARPMTSPSIVRRVLRVIDVEPTALPDLVIA
jgi:excisionase family DNA binding protein